ncbi:hypothetical protein J4E83_008693 [Alternaria metachromatica]|uniref:uncharacterized protein n=1 Tax=Alternaria metachromatica TaxID=283354 RepID=UPI0020C4A9A6|nr:uncharacterized protein J4E83_008693 [Alternaria metachromatica]KAI4609523.1 hypothetical protein J4E83_008693 [Alternaria metachromatica]
MTDFTKLPLQQAVDDIELDELLTKLHRNDLVSPSLVTTIAKHASSLGESICADYHTLNTILVRHEATIRKRWTKKSPAQRRDILLEAWPNMPEVHRPDYAEIANIFTGTRNAAVLKEALLVQDKEVLPTDAKMWPFINLEDLSKPKCLLIFLNARGRNVPLIFAPTEEEFSPLAQMSPCGSEPELEKYLLQFSRDPSPAVYGKTNLLTRPIDDYVLNEDGYEYCPRTSLQTLHIQQRILKFLVTCIKLILHDHTEETLLRGTVQEEPPYTDLELRGDVGYTTFADALVIAPYRNRASIDFTRLRGYFNALRTNAKDHILALREDPSYFAEVFVDIADHSPLMIKDEQGKVHPALGGTSFLLVKAREVVIEAYTMFSVWQEIYSIVDELSGTSQQESNDRFSCLMGELNCRTRKASTLLHRMLSQYAMCAPNMRGFFRRTDHSGANAAIRFMPSSISTFEEFRIVESFHCLENQPNHNPNDAALYHLLDDVASVFRANETTKDLMSPRVSQLFAQTSVVAECIMQHSVWYDTPQGNGINKNAPHSHREDFLQWLYHLDQCQLPVHAINPFRGKLAYPAHKVRNRSNIQAMRTAEATLDRFWECVDTFYEEKTGISQHEVIRQCILEGGQMQRTPPWEEPLATNPKPMGQPEYVYQPFSRIFHNQAMQITGAFDRLAIEEKTKPKTKGSTTVPVADEPANMVPAASEDTSQQTFTLDKRAYRTMKALFHVALSDDEDFPKAIKWDEFKRAMVRIGFAAEKLQGSAWQFTPSKALDVDRGIHFHEPHPDSDIPYIMARRFGRRLERVYGWRSEFFKLS